MLARRNLEEISNAIGHASALTEEKFLDVGKRLESSVEILGKLTATFEGLFDELNSENVQRATEDLGAAASQVSDLVHAHTGEKDALGRLAKLIAAIENGVSLVHKAVRGAELLGTSSKIAAAHIGEAGGDFISFANEIGRSLKLAQTTLDRFRSELAEVGKHLDAAKASQTVFEAQQTGAIRTVPARLATSVEAIAAHSRQAVAAATVVQEKARQVSQRIGSAVMALQIGDRTRQRIEHAASALGIVDDILRGADTETADDPWRSLDDGQRQALAMLGCRLQSAQLSDAADDFEKEIRQILSSILQLATDARDILRLGNETYGAGERRHGPFLLELKEDVSQAHVLLEGFRAARMDINGVMSAVSKSGASLVGHIDTVRSLEADIRIMGLNATLKCGRLGSQGRPLSVIAQELRVYANHIAAHAGTIMADLEAVVGSAGALSRGDHGAVDIATVAQVMTNSVDRLGAAGRSLADALATLDRDSGTVAMLLDETAQHIRVHEEIGQTLRTAAADLARFAPEPASPSDAATPPACQMLEMMARSYTMEKERIIHERVVPGTSGQAFTPGPPTRQAAPSAVEPAIDDLLF